MSVIAAVLGYKNPELIHQTLAYFGEKDIVLIDNGSPTPLQFPIPTFRFHENKLFTGGWLQAMPFLMGYDYVLMMNSDCIDMTADKMFALYTIMVTHPDKPVVLSPTFNSPHAHMQPMEEYNAYARRVRWIDWTCPLVSTQWWREIGGFDPQFKGYGADLDICYRGRNEGRSGFFVTDKVSFTHQGSVTAYNEGKIGEQGNVGEMNRLFQEKYGVNNWGEIA